MVREAYAPAVPFIVVELKELVRSETIGDGFHDCRLRMRLRQTVRLSWLLRTLSAPTIRRPGTRAYVRVRAGTLTEVDQEGIVAMRRYYRVRERHGRDAGAFVFRTLTREEKRLALSAACQRLAREGLLALAGDDEGDELWTVVGEVFRPTSRAW